MVVVFFCLGKYTYVSHMFRTRFIGADASGLASLTSSITRGYFSHATYSASDKEIESLKSSLSVFIKLSRNFLFCLGKKVYTTRDKSGWWNNYHNKIISISPFPISRLRVGVSFSFVSKDQPITELIRQPVNRRANLFGVNSRKTKINKS